MKLKMADTGATLVDSATNFSTPMCNTHPLAPSDNTDETRGLLNKLTYCLSLLKTFISSRSFHRLSHLL